MVYDKWAAVTYKCQQFCNDVYIQQNCISGSERHLLPHTRKQGRKPDIISLHIFDLLRKDELVFVTRSIFYIQMYHCYGCKGYCVNNEIFMLMLCT